MSTAISSKHLRIYLALLIVAFASLVTPGCRRELSAPAPTAQNPAPALKHVTLATSTNLWCTLPLVAQEKGFFKKRGLDVGINIQDGGRYCMDALLGGSANFANVVEVNIAYLAYTGNNDVRVVGNVVDSTSMAVVGWKTSGINTATDLKGKRLGFTPGTQGEIFAARFLAKHGVPLDPANVRKLQPKAIPAAIAAHEVDAASTWEPFVNSALKAMGDNGVVFRDPEAHRGYMHVAVRQSWAAQNSDAVVAFLAALKEADQFVTAHPDEAQQILARKTGLDLAIVKSIWNYYNVHLTFDKPALVNVTTSVGRWIHDTQPTYAAKPVPDYGPYYDDSYFRRSQ